MKVRLGLYLLFIFFLLEVCARLYFYIAWDTPLFAKENMIYHFYPELNGVKEKYYEDKSKIKLLVLGGSAVTADLYCDLDFELRSINRTMKHDEREIRVYNLARSGQTSFDSRIKRQFLADLKFDYTFIYDGFNDCRANNIPKEYFDIDYRHFMYYQEVDLYMQYIKNHISILPFCFNFIATKLFNFIKESPHVPPYYIVKDNKVLDASYWEEGKEIKTITSFSKNLKEIYAIQNKVPNQNLILSTYAYYSPNDYSLTRFYKKELDYQEQKWPTEIYGDYRYIPSCVDAHNQILSSWKDSSKVFFIELNSIIPKNKTYYNDICHLTDSGCMMMAKQIYSIIYSNDSILHNATNGIQ